MDVFKSLVGRQSVVRISKCSIFFPVTSKFRCYSWNNNHNNKIKFFVEKKRISVAV